LFVSTRPRFRRARTERAASAKISPQMTNQAEKRDG
jgi:hypothetical protein